MIPDGMCVNKNATSLFFLKEVLSFESGTVSTGEVKSLKKISFWWL